VTALELRTPAAVTSVSDVIILAARRPGTRRRIRRPTCKARLAITALAIGSAAVLGCHLVALPIHQATRTAGIEVLDPVLRAVQ
jgi:hypothetical protein